MSGTVGIQNPLLIRADITGDATGVDNYAVTRAGSVLDVWVIATATNMGGTMTVSNAASAITNAIAMATDTNVARAGTIQDANILFAAGGDMRFTANGAADRGIVCVLYVPAATTSALT